MLTSYLFESLYIQHSIYFLVLSILLILLDSFLLLEILWNYSVSQAIVASNCLAFLFNLGFSFQTSCSQQLQVKWVGLTCTEAQSLPPDLQFIPYLAPCCRSISPCAMPNEIDFHNESSTIAPENYPNMLCPATLITLFSLINTLTFSTSSQSSLSAYIFDNNT